MPASSIFAQVIKLIPRSTFDKSVDEHEGDKGVRNLDCWSWFGALLFAQLSGHASIRALERVFNHRRVREMGFAELHRSTLADANRVRPVAILEDMYRELLGQAHQLSPAKTGFRFKGRIFAMDSTTIELCLSLSPWARFHHGKGACKLHTAIDIGASLPYFAVITNGRTHDIRPAKKKKRFQKGDTALVDRAYVDFAWLNSLNNDGIFFVTRMKSNCRYQVLECHPHDRTKGLRADQTIRLTTWKGKLYEEPLRRVSYRDPETGKWLVFITNRFDLSAKTICDLYKARWRVELFFKTMKSHMKIRKFLGRSENSIRAQILMALIAYLLIQLLRFSFGSNISIPEAVAALSTLLLLNEPLQCIFGHQPPATQSSQLTASCVTS